MRLRKIITGTITAGGVTIFLVTFGILCIVRKVKKIQERNSNKVIIHLAKNSIDKCENSFPAEEEFDINDT